MIKLITLTKEYEQELKEMIKEWKEDQDKNHTNHSPWAIFKNDCDDFDYYLENLDFKTPIDNHVVTSTFFLYDDERKKLLGACNIRHTLNDALLKSGGHIGDGIRPSERKKGYGTKIISLALEECKKLNIDKVLITCDKDNIASRKTIINNGGILENEIEEDGEIIQRYWIDLKKNKVVDEFEQSITKKYRAKIWSRFVCAIKEYKLLNPGDKICVCISGGKDSMLMARLFMQLKKHSDFNFDVKYLVMNPGYNKENLDLIKKNLEILSIPASISETNIFDVASEQEKNPCFLCAKMRRGALYRLAKEMGCNKIALGHHYDDVIETTLMNMLNSGSFQTMIPKLKSNNFEGMELIRPMYLIREKDINSWKNYHNLTFIQCACKLTSQENYENELTQSQRQATKLLIKQLTKNYNSQVEQNIFKAAENVTLDMILGYKEDGVKHIFLEEYDDEIKKG